MVFGNAISYFLPMYNHGLKAYHQRPSQPPALGIHLIPEISGRYIPIRRNPAKRPSKHIVLPAGPFSQSGFDDAHCGILPVPTGWKEYIHPEGKVYYVNEVTKVVTYAQIREKQTFDDVNAYYKDLKARLDECLISKSFTLPNCWELCIELEPRIGYYFVDHGNRSLFWLDDTPLEYLRIEPRNLPVEEASIMTIKLTLEKEFFRHVEYFPMHSNTCLASCSETELRSLLIFSWLDHTTGDDSTGAFPAEDCEQLFKILNAIPNDTSEHSSGYRNWVIARLFHTFARSRSLDWYAQPWARLSHSESVDPSPPPKAGRIYRYSMTLLSFLLLNIHHPYLERIETMWVDKLVRGNQWKEFIESLMADWGDSNLLANVVLAANMAFLALTNDTNVMRISSLVSTLFAIASIICGVHNLWMHRVRLGISVHDAAPFLGNAQAFTNSMEPLAIFLSLPIIFFAWSITCFTLSIALLSLSNSILLPERRLGGTIIGFTLASLGIGLILCFAFFNQVWHGIWGKRR